MSKANEIYDNKYDQKPKNLNDRQKYVVWHLLNNKDRDISGRRILEIGCGSGTLAKALSGYGADVTGVEISSSAVESTRSKGIECYEEDISSNVPKSLVDKTFDTVILVEVIEHVFDHIQLLTNANQLMEKKGELVMTTHNSIQYSRVLKYIMGRSPTGTQNATHVRFYSEQYLQELLARQGFEVALSNGVSTKKRLSQIIPNRYFPTLFILAEKWRDPEIESIETLFKSELTGPELIYGTDS